MVRGMLLVSAIALTLSFSSVVRSDVLPGGPDPRSASLSAEQLGYDADTSNEIAQLIAQAPSQAQPDAAAPPAAAKEAPVAPAAPAPPKPPAASERQNRINWGGEVRFRIMDEFGDAPNHWAGSRISLSSKGNTDGVFALSGVKDINPNGRNDQGVSFPLRLRLNWDAVAVPDWVDVYGRFTINKRWGTYASTPEQDPFNAPNSFSASIGSDIALRAEQIYATVKIPRVPWDVVWYVGRLPGLDGPPSRSARSIFPRIFIDSEIDGTLLKAALPELPSSEQTLPFADVPIEGFTADVPRGGPMAQYENKLKDRSAIIVGYIDYNETKLTAPGGKNSVEGDDFVPFIGHGPDSAAWLGQIQLKLLKDTQLILDGLWMTDWYMPRQDFGKDNSFTQSIMPVYNPNGGTAGTGSWTPGIDIPFFGSDYGLFGGYLDTQVAGFQLYGSLYFNRLDVPSFAYQTLYPKADGTVQRGETVNYEGHDFNGHMWHLGFNTGPWLAKWNLSFCTEYAKGSDEWINPFNYRGYRRKGSVLYPEKNAFFGGNQVVGFYPFNAGVLDSYLDYYWRRARFRAGLMYFEYDRHDLPTLTATGETSYTATGDAARIFGWSRYKTEWWPYAELNLSF
jgi:hypothetical protein